jgi:hypothetical protein
MIDSTAHGRLPGPSVQNEQKHITGRPLGTMLENMGCHSVGLCVGRHGNSNDSRPTVHTPRRHKQKKDSGAIIGVTGRNLRSRRPRGLSRGLSSPAPTLRSWVRIPLKHGCLCVFILCLCCPVCRKRLYDGLIPRPRSPTDSWV